MYQAMARRYRPHTFDDVIGQEHVAQTLKNSITANRVAHAYLFCGPHGCGKTSMARIFACALVCETGPTDSPCGKCPVCIDVLRGQDVDVQEIDGASNNGVEQVRALREQVGYVPSRARYKIYIIDEVHMLSVAAFNALLKTLEEPPAHVKFILATTDPHKILGTILSRCQRFDFRLVPPPKMSAYLKKLVASEAAQITDDALAAVAAFSGGSMRDGLVLLDQLVSFSSGSVTREDVERVRGVAGAESVAGLFEAVASHDIKRALGIVDAVNSRGTNVGDFLDQLIAFGRDLMHVVATGGDEGISAYGPAKSILLELSSAVTLEQVLLVLDVLTQARTRIRSKALTNPLIPLEMAVARLAGLESLSPVNDIVEKLSAYASGAPLPDITQKVTAPVSQITQGIPATTEVNTENVSPEKVSLEKVLDDENQIAENKSDQVDTTVHGFVPKNEEVHFCPSEDSGVPWFEEGNVSSENISDTINSSEAVSDQPPVGKAQEFQSQEPDTSTNQCDNSQVTLSTQTVLVKDSAAQPDIDLRALWKSILNTLAQKSRTDAPFLGDVYIDKYTSGQLYLSVPGGGTFIYEQLEDKHRKQRIAKSAEDVLGNPVEVHLVLREAMNSAPVEEYESHNSMPPSHAQQAFVSPAQKMADAGRERGVRIILDNFEGSIINIEDA